MYSRDQFVFWIFKLIISSFGYGGIEVKITVKPGKIFSKIKNFLTKQRSENLLQFQIFSFFKIYDKKKNVRKYNTFDSFFLYLIQYKKELKMYKLRLFVSCPSIFAKRERRPPFQKKKVYAARDKPHLFLFSPFFAWKKFFLSFF